MFFSRIVKICQVIKRLVFEPVIPIIYPKIAHIPTLIGCASAIGYNLKSHDHILLQIQFVVPAVIDPISPTNAVSFAP
jgi:hypothetical protein